ncbi:MAG TPA: AAA family ATPase [Chitinophagales bacterium]|nr:AAA family ATPase [Chitinophagales bacterium]HRK27273.1 AAA family ATPase [Chitinophagales bacterium]
MIKELHLKNWKSFLYGQLYIDPLTILIGANASGKSNILDALLFLQKITTGKELNAAMGGDLDSKGIRGGHEWAITYGFSETEITALIQSDTDEHIDYRYNIVIGLVEDGKIEMKSESLTRITESARGERKTDKRMFYTGDYDLNQPAIITYFHTSTQGRDKRVDLRRAYSVLSQSKLLPLLKEVQQSIEETIRQLSRIFVLDPIPANMRGYTKFSDRLLPDASNMAGVLAALNNESKQEIENTLTQYLKRLPEKEINQVWAEPVGLLRTDAMLYCKEKWFEQDQLIVDAGGMSDGTLRFLAIMTAMLTMPQHSLLVVEEIDNGFHPSRAKLLVQFLKEEGNRRSIDVLCTTHNPAFLDALGNEMIPVISVVYRNKQTGASQIKLLEDIAQLPKLMSRGTVGNLTTSGILEEVLGL